MRRNVEKGVSQVGSGLTHGGWKVRSLRAGIAWNGEIRCRVNGTGPVQKNVEAFVEIRSGTRGYCG